MLGTQMATKAFFQPDECIGEKRDPCASPPCKRLKQAALPCECIIIDDNSNESTTNPLQLNPVSTEELECQLPHQENSDKKQSSANNEQCAEAEDSDDALMETDSPSEDQTMNQNEAKLPSLSGGGSPETTSDEKTNSYMKSSCSQNHKSCIPSNKYGLLSNDVTTKERGSLLKFLQPVTPGSKSTVEHFKIPLKDAKTLSKDSESPTKDSGKTPPKSNVVGSPHTPIDTKQSLGPGKTTEEKTPSPASSNGVKKATSARKTPGRKLSVEEKSKREEERLRKQKEKEALEQERLEKKKEKERLKEEKQKERMEEKRKKEQEKLEQLEVKKQREKERIEKKEQEEKEKRERMEKKEEVKRKKEEEKKKKEDEKNLKNEEKRKKEEEENLKKQKAMNSFASFFIKKQVTAPAKPKEQVPKEAKFQPFELKPFMKLASAPYRKPLSEDAEKQLTKHLMEQATTSLHQIKEELLALRKHAYQIKLDEDESKTITVADNECDEVMIVDDERPLGMNTTANSIKQEICKVKGKLLQFHENYRPAYFGSWRKKSSSIGPRSPFKKDADILNYDVDSDDEWEEEEPGESLSNSEGEDEEDGCPNEDEETDEDGFLVPHGYLSDGEGDAEDEDMDHVGEEKHTRNNTEDKMERHLAKQKTWEAELNRQFRPMKPVAIGCIWDGEIPAILKQLEACLLLAEDTIDPAQAVKKEHLQDSTTPTSSPSTYCNTTMPVPEEAMPLFIKMLHGSTAGLKKAVRLFRKRWTLQTKKDANITEENWESHCTISKRQVEKKITSIAVKEVRSSLPKSRWYVHSSILSQYGLENITLSLNGLVASKDKSPPVSVRCKSPGITTFTSPSSKHVENQVQNKLNLPVSSAAPSHVAQSKMSPVKTSFTKVESSEKQNEGLAQKRTDDSAMDTTLPAVTLQ